MLPPIKVGGKHIKMHFYDQFQPRMPAQMTFLRSRRSQFIAWTVIYAGFVWLLTSKGGGESLVTLVWGLALGAGAGIATCIPGPEGRMQRLLRIGVWFVASWVIAVAMFWNERGANSTIVVTLENAAVMTLIAGLPALLALAVWIFRRPRFDPAKVSAASSGTSS
ncbi:MAG TPA: hypothetical protein VMZ25_09485 [Terriglobales bacterium]|nr:hypothetical protein [Terriglobales bacterium]